MEALAYLTVHMKSIMADSALRRSVLDQTPVIVNRIFVLFRQPTPIDCIDLYKDLCRYCLEYLYFVTDALEGKCQAM